MVVTDDQVNDLFIYSYILIDRYDISLKCPRHWYHYILSESIIVGKNILKLPHQIENGEKSSKWIVFKQAGYFIIRNIDESCSPNCSSNALSLPFQKRG